MALNGGAPQLGFVWLLQADITAVTWRFTRDILPEALSAEMHPQLARLAARAEALPAFRAAPPA